MKHISTTLLLFILSISSIYGKPLVSPNGKISIEYLEQQGFTVKYNDGNGYKEVVKLPKIGLKTTGNDRFELLNSTSYKHIIDDYKMLSGKRRHCQNEANESVYKFINADGLHLDVIVRAYNNGIAFRYHLSDVKDKIEVTDELTEFAFKVGIKRWTQKYAWGYEDFYTPNIDGIAKNKERDWSFPALFQPTESTFVLLAEANVLRGNTGAHLTNKYDASVYKIKMLDEKITCSSGWYSPWRLAMIGSLSDIVESTLVTDVSEPSKIKDTSWIRPGVVSWIYWAYNHGSKDYQIVKKYIDFAKDFNLPYVLIDWEWDEMSNGGNLEDAVKYCKRNGISPLLWYNSSTAWCGPTPLYRLNKPDERKKEFEWLSKLGVKGVKVDFFAGDSISSMNYYIDLLEDAAKYKLLVNFHGGAIPRGWQRTYPNFMSAEAVYGAEWYNNNSTMTDSAAWHNSTLPFTRNVIGPMDYTPCAFTDSNYPHTTTDAHELSLLVTFESALQHLADRPEGYMGQPNEVRELIKHLPTVWDDTKLLSGYPSERVVIARKSNNLWYIAGLNGTNDAKTLSFDLNFIKERAKSIQLFSDSAGGTKMQIENINSDKKKFDVSCSPRGGFVAIVTIK